MEQLTELKVLLLTKDNEHIKTAQASLASFGVKEVLVMEDGLLALEKIKTAAFDFLICDQDIRYISGWMLIREIKLAEQIPNIPVLLFGKGEPPDSAENLQRYGIVKYLKSPFLPSNLNFLIHSTISLNKTSGTIENKYSLAKISLINRNTEEAIYQFSQLKQLTENSARSMICLAQSHAQKGDIASAEYLLEQVATEAEDTPSRMMMQARIHLQKGDFKTADKLLKNLISVIPNEFYYCRVVLAYMDFNYYKDAETVCLDAIEREYHLLDIYSCLAKCYYSNGIMDKSLVTINEAEIMFGMNAELFNLRGVCLKKSGKFEDAIYAYEEAFRLNPSDAKIYFNLAMCAIGMKDYPLAHRHLATCIKIAPRFPKAAEKLAEIDARIRADKSGKELKAAS